MDNNKTVDNLNFIKIYFRVFIYKIVVLKYPELSKKRWKIIKKGWKRVRYKDWPKNLRRGVQMAPKHESAFGAIRPIRYFWSAKWHFKRAECPWCGIWPNNLQVTIMHTFINLFAKGCVRIQILIVRTYFLESSDLYK